MDDAVTDVLKTIGWDSGFRLPIANEENQALERELARLVIKKSAMSKEHSDITNRCKNMEDHLKYVRQEVQQNQVLLSTYRQQLDNERHKLKLKQSETDNIVSESRRLAKLTGAIKDRLASKKLLLARNLAKLEKMKTEAEWDNQAMKAWEESVKKRDDDNELLKKFSDEDRKKLNELETKRKNLQSEVNVRKTMLAQMDVDVMNYEQVMKRTGKMLVSLKDERHGLVSQWQESVKNLRQKDMDIRRAHTNLDNIQYTIKQKREEMEDQEAFLSSEKNANKYIDMEINDVNVTSLRMRKEHYKAISDNLHLISDHTTKKKFIQNAANEFNKVKNQLKNASKIKETFQKKITKIRQDLESLKEHNEYILEQSTSASKNADLMDKMIQETEKNGQYLTRQMQTLLAKQYQKNVQTNDLTVVTNAHKAEVCALENALGQIRKRSAFANQELIHKKQLLSDLEMKVACLEAQMGNTDLDDIEDFEEIWKIKIADLEEIQGQHTELKHLLHGQILNLQKENLRLVNCMANDAPAQQAVKDKLQSLCLQIEGGIKQTKAATLRTQQLQVQENLLRLQVDKMKDALNSADEEIYNMQRYKIDLESVLKERHIEVNAAKEVLFAKKKNLDEDRSRLKADLSQRCVKIQQLENKYNLSLGMLGTDECGEPMSVSAFKVKAAEEKYELQQEGDELDKKIRKAEQEIVAMENTLKIVNMTNKSFKDSLTIIDQDSQDAEEMKQMEETLTVSAAQLKDKRHDLYVEVNKLKELKKEHERYVGIKARVVEDLQALESTLAHYEKEAAEREEKIERATRHLVSCSKKIEKSQIEKYDRELYIRQLQDTNKSVLYQLADFTVQYPQNLPIIRVKFEMHQLDMPKPRSSLGSVSSDSVQSVHTTGPPSSHSSGAYNSIKSSSSKEVFKPERQRQQASTANVTSVELTFDMSTPSTAGGNQGRQSRASTVSNASEASLRKNRKESKTKR